MIIDDYRWYSTGYSLDCRAANHTRVNDLLSRTNHPVHPSTHYVSKRQRSTLKAESVCFGRISVVDLAPADGSAEGGCVCVFFWRALHIGSWHNLTLQMPHTTIQDMGIPATLDGEFQFHLPMGPVSRQHESCKSFVWCLRGHRVGTGWGMSCLVLLGLSQKFGPPKSHKISLELVDYHHLHLGGVLSLWEALLVASESRVHCIPFLHLSGLLSVTSTGVPTKLDQSGLVHPSCC